MRLPRALHGPSGWASWRRKVRVLQGHAEVLSDVFPVTAHILHVDYSRVSISSSDALPKAFP